MKIIGDFKVTKIYFLFLDRCTRSHPGGADKCKSVDKICKRCGIVGHFVEVHDVMDVEFRKLITMTLGFDIYNVGYLAAIENGETALGILPNPQPEKFNDWYSG